MASIGGSVWCHSSTIRPLARKSIVPTRKRIVDCGQVRYNGLGPRDDIRGRPIRDSLQMIFISYRSLDSAHFVDRLHARIVQAFGEKRVFLEKKTRKRQSTYTNRPLNRIRAGSTFPIRM